MDQWLIRKFSAPATSVYVPCCGTGSAVIAALLEGRVVLACDTTLAPYTQRLINFAKETKVCSNVIA